MASAENLRNDIIEKILTISNKEYLTALYQLLQNSPYKNKIALTEEQIFVLQLSEKDIEEGRLISQDQMNEEDLKWLKEM